MTTKDEALQRLRELLPPGTTVYTILRHVSRSGMSRRISAVVVRPNMNKNGGAPDTLQLDHLIEAAGIFKQHSRHEGLVLGGCGMDMGFHLVCELSSHLYPDGFGCIGVDCPSNDHANGDRDHTPHASHVHADEQRAKLGKSPTGAGHWHHSGGYALWHRWL